MKYLMIDHNKKKLYLIDSESMNMILQWAKRKKIDYDELHDAAFHKKMRSLMSRGYGLTDVKLKRSFVEETIKSVYGEV